MDNINNLSWLQDPSRISEVNYVPLLSVSLKRLQDITEDYAINGILNVWRTTQYQSLSVVARVLECQPQLVLSDNTDTYIFQGSNMVGSLLVFRHQYYRFGFEISPYALNSVALVGVQPVSPEEIGAHLIAVVQDEMKSTMHWELMESYEQRFRDELMEIISQWTTFTLEDIEKKVRSTIVGDVDLPGMLERLANEGVIGDMGNYYWVVEKQ